MRAIVRLASGQPDLMLAEVPKPQVGERELLVRVHAIGVGMHDEYFYASTVQYPYVIGIEAAGVIEKLGSSVVDYAVGDRITFISAMQPKGGTWAEYTVVKVDSLILRIPDRMSFESAAAIPVAGNTALKVFHALNLRSDDTLFIAGASGAIGTFAIQLAISRGYRVAASASMKNHDYLLVLGAHKTVDYHDLDWTEQIRQWQPDGVDAAIAIPSGSAFACMSIIKDGGDIITVSGDQFTPERDISLRHIAYEADVKNELANLVNGIDVGKVHLTIEKIYPFKDGLEALKKTKSGHARGKLVLIME